MKNKHQLFFILTLCLIIFSFSLPVLAQEIPEVINAPFVGEIQTKNFSLPILTIIIAALDGFNPCAMWTLLFLITLLISMKNKKRMWLLGSIFIIASGAVYFLFMTAWLNFFLFIGFVFWIRLAIAIFAIGAGFYQLKKYRDDKDGTCKVVTEKRKTRFEKIKEIVYRKNIFYALIGIILLAGAVNLVELLCSAGLPAIYTSILTLTNVSTWQYYLYLVFYIVIFMLDDLIIFFIAMLTLQTVGISKKYSRFSSLIGGIIMLIIGLLLIFKPEWLMFG